MGLSAKSKCPLPMTIYLLLKALSLPYHSLVRHDLFDVSIEERDDDSLTVNADVFSCTVCESNYARAITVYFLNLKQNHSPDIVFLEFL